MIIDSVGDAGPADTLRAVSWYEFHDLASTQRYKSDFCMGQLIGIEVKHEDASTFLKRSVGKRT
jgi:hypothetical protein